MFFCRYGLAEGAIVLVSALSASDAQPHVAASAQAAAGEPASDGAALAEVMQGDDASPDAADDLAAATADAAAALQEAEAASAAKLMAAEGVSPSAAVKAEPQPEEQQPSRVTAGDSAEAITELAPAAVRTAAAETAAASSPQPDAQQQNGTAEAAQNEAEAPTVGSKRPLEGDAASQGPPLKVKRETF